MKKMKLNIQLFASVSSSKHDGRYLKLTATETATDVVANTSTVHWKFESIGGNDTYYTIYEYGVFYNGNQLYDGTSGLKNKNWSAKTFPAKKGSVEGDITITHNPDGSAPNVAFAMFGSVSANNTKQYDLSLPLTQLQRGSNLDSFSTSNSTATLTYTKYVSSFYDVITFTSNGQTLAVLNNPVPRAGSGWGLTANYNMSAVLAASTAAQNKTITITATLKTYTDSSCTTQVGATITKTAEATLGSSTLNSISSMIIYSDGYATFNPSITKWVNGTYDCIEVSGGTFSQTFNNISDGGTNVFNSANLFAAMGTNTSLALSFTLKTYSSNGGTLLGESTVNNQTISLPSYSMTASVDSFGDQTTTPAQMSDSLSTFKPNASTMIKGLSTPIITYRVGTSTSHLYGRAISTSGAKVVSGLGHNSTFTLEPGTNMGDTYTISATDGRVQAATATQTFTVVPYFTPIVNVKFVRTAPTASTATATVTVTYYNDTSNLLTNKKTLSTINTAILTYTETGGSAITKSYSDTTPTETISGNTTTATFVYNITGLDYQKSIAVSAQFKDLIGYTVNTNTTIPNGLPAINAFRYNDKNYAKVNGDLIVNGELTTNNHITTNADVRAGSLELSYLTPFIDFHYNNTSGDYTSRIIEWASGTLTMENNFTVNGDLKVNGGYIAKELTNENILTLKPGYYFKEGSTGWTENGWPLVTWHATLKVSGTAYNDDYGYRVLEVITTDNNVYRKTQSWGSWTNWQNISTDAYMKPISSRLLFYGSHLFQKNQWNNLLYTYGIANGWGSYRTGYTRWARFIAWKNDNVTSGTGLLIGFFDQYDNYKNLSANFELTYGTGANERGAFYQSQFMLMSDLNYGWQNIKTIIPGDSNGTQGYLMSLTMEVFDIPDGINPNYI